MSASLFFFVPKTPKLGETSRVTAAVVSPVRQEVTVAALGVDDHGARRYIAARPRGRPRPRLPLLAAVLGAEAFVGERGGGDW